MQDFASALAADKWPLCVQDHNYTAPLPCTPPLSPLAPPSPTSKLGGGVTPSLGGLQLDDTGSTALASAAGIKEVVVSTTTTTGDPAVGDDSVTRCICDFQHDDGYMICCDLCGSVSPCFFTLYKSSYMYSVFKCIHHRQSKKHAATLLSVSSQY